MKYVTYNKVFTEGNVKAKLLNPSDKFLDWLKDSTVCNKRIDLLTQKEFFVVDIKIDEVKMSVKKLKSGVKK